MVRPQLQQLLKKLYTQPTYRSLFPASINWQQGSFLAGLLRQHKPKIVLELGSGRGVAAIWIQSAIAAQTQLISVDPWSKYPDIVKKTLQKTHHKLVKTQTSQHYLAWLSAQPKKSHPDCIILDADERFDGFMADFYFVNRIMQTGNQVLVRNCWNPSVRLALRFVVRNLPYRLIGVPAWITWVVEQGPSFGLGWLLYYATRHYTAEWCVLQKTGPDTRPWNHFQRFT